MKFSITKNKANLTLPQNWTWILSEKGFT